MPVAGVHGAKSPVNTPGGQTGFDIPVFIDIISGVIRVEIKGADLKIDGERNYDQKQADPRFVRKL